MLKGVKSLLEKKIRSIFFQILIKDINVIFLRSQTICVR